MKINLLFLIILLQGLSFNVQSDSVHQVPSFVESTLLPSGYCKESIKGTFYPKHDSNYNIQSEQYKRNLMQSAVCFHSFDRLKEAKELYYYVRQQFPNFAFPLVNIALIDLKDGKSQNVIDTLDLYFQEVGGMFGNMTKLVEMKDNNAKMFGPHCLPKALYHSECVSALNFYGIAQVEMYNYEKAMESYLQAIEIGSDDVYFISDVYQNLATLYKTMGLFDDAANSFLQSFWSNVRIKKDFNPTPLLERAMLVPSISTSLGESLSFKKSFEKRFNDLMQLVEFGGSSWVDDGDLFKVRDGVSNLDDIRALQVR
jgi:tetratricopeptide (TPR) repeat protein